MGILLCFLGLKNHLRLSAFNNLSDSIAWRKPYQDIHRFEDLQDDEIKVF